MSQRRKAGRFPRFATAAAAASLATVLAAGCSSATAGNSSTSSGTGGTSGTAVTKITIATVAPAALLTIPAYAVSKGIFAKYHLDVSIQVLTSTTIYPAFASGKAQFAAMPAPQPEIGQLQGVDLKWIASWANDTPFDIVAAPGIKSVSGLANKKIAETAPGSTTDLFPRLALAKFGVPASSVQLVPLGSVSTNLSSFIAGSVDAFATAPPIVQAALKGRPGSSVIYQMSNLLHWPSGGLVAYMPYATAHPQVTEDLVKAMSEAVQDWLADPAGAEKVIAQQTSVTMAQAAAAYKSVTGIVKAAENLVPSLSDETEVLHALAQTGTSKAASANPADFIDTTFAQDALK